MNFQVTFKDIKWKVGRKLSPIQFLLLQIFVVTFKSLWNFKFLNLFSNIWTSFTTCNFACNIKENSINVFKIPDIKSIAQFKRDFIHFFLLEQSIGDSFQNFQRVQEIQKEEGGANLFWITSTFLLAVPTLVFLFFSFGKTFEFI